MIHPYPQGRTRAQSASTLLGALLLRLSHLARGALHRVSCRPGAPPSRALLATHCCRSILDIEQTGVPPPPKMDAYLKARVDKMYAQLAVSPSALCAEHQAQAAAPCWLDILPTPSGQLSQPQAAAPCWLVG